MPLKSKTPPGVCTSQRWLISVHPEAPVFEDETLAGHSQTCSIFMITEIDSVDNVTDKQQPFHYSICYDILSEYLGGMERAGLVQRIHYWLQNEKSGYLLKDGTKWIFNGYLEWQQQFTWRSPQQIGRDIRYLEEIGWLKSQRFWELNEIGFVTPVFLHHYNQRKWYRLDYQKIYEDTGLDLLFNQPSEPQKAPKRSPRAIVHP